MRNIIPDSVKENIIKEYVSGIGCINLSMKYRVSSDSVLRFCKDHGVEIRNTSPAYRLPINHNFFHAIDSEEKAYWLGFICADGNVYGNSFCIDLKIQDISHLYKLKSSLNSGHKISESVKYSRCSIKFRSEMIVKDLYKYGITENKSLTLNPNISLIPENLHRHFWRGMIDGDGYISPDRHNIFLCGTSDVVYKFSDFIYNINKPPYLIRNPNEDKNHFRINVYGEYVKDIIVELYRYSSVYLNRKYETSLRYL